MKLKAATIEAWHYARVPYSEMNWFGKLTSGVFLTSAFPIIFIIHFLCSLGLKD